MKKNAEEVYFKGVCFRRLLMQFQFIENVSMKFVKKKTLFDRETSYKNNNLFHEVAPDFKQDL